MRSPVLTVAVLAVVLAGCSGEPGSTTSTSTTASTSTTTTTALASGPAPVPAGEAVELDVTLPRRIPAAATTWVIEVTNLGEEPVVLTFPSAQRGDATLLRDEVVVHRWSDGRFFAQELHEQPVAPGETIEVEVLDDLSDVEPGYYSLVLDLAVVGPPAAIERSVRIVEAESTT